VRVLKRAGDSASDTSPCIQGWQIGADIYPSMAQNASTLPRLPKPYKAYSNVKVPSFRTSMDRMVRHEFGPQKHSFEYCGIGLGTIAWLTMTLQFAFEARVEPFDRPIKGATANLKTQC